MNFQKNRKLRHITHTILRVEPVVFERRAGGAGGAGGLGAEEEAPLAVQQAALCAESRRLCVALPHGHVVLFKFRKSEVHAETHVSIYTSTHIG